MCDKTDGMSCEVIQSWQDDTGKIRRDPIQLSKSNHIAFQLYEKTIQLGVLREYHWEHNKKQFRGYFPDLSKVDFILNKYLAPDIDIDELDLILDKIILIHSMKLNAMVK